MNIREEAKYVAVICNLIQFLVEDGAPVPDNIIKLQNAAANTIVNEKLLNNDPMQEMTAGLLQGFIYRKEFD